MGKPQEQLEAPAVEVDISEADELAGIEEAAKTEKAEKAERAEKPAKDAKASDAKKQDETVPHAALHEEREKRKAIEKQLREEKRANEERQARLDERLRILNETLAPKPAPVDPRQNPLGYVQQTAAELAEWKRHQAQESQTRAEAQRQQQEEARLWEGYRSSGREFTQTTPDFPDAYNFLLVSRAQELEAMGFDPATIAETIKNDEFNLAYNAQQKGVSAAEIIYNWAKVRGFTKGASQSPQKGKGDIDRLRNAQDASETLSKSGGSAGDAGRISLQSLDRMSNDEFNAFVARQNSKDPNGMDKLYARLEGGRK